MVPRRISGRGVLLLASSVVTLYAQLSSAQSAATVDEARIGSLLDKLDLQERVSLMSGASAFATTKIEELGIRSMRFADGPSGVRSNEGDEATAFPVGITMASTWNPALIQQVGAAIGEEARAMGNHVLLGPNLNLVRSPLSGRNFETYGEDPFLAGQMGIGFINGLQSKGVSASAKHFVGNEQETERNRGNSVIDPRALNELYLKPFEMAVRQAHPWTVMTAYNRTNGTYMSEHTDLVRNLLKDKWGYDGVVMSDWGGTHSMFAATAGLDLEMPGPAYHFGHDLQNAVGLFQVPASVVEDAARRMLRLAARVGALDADLKPQGEVSTAAHRMLARNVAAQAITLLKNQNNVLPLSTSGIRKLAVIGPNADAVVVEGGGSAQVVPSDIVSPLDAIRNLLGNGAVVRYEQGVDNDVYTPAIDGRDLSTALDRKQRGLTVRYWANEKFAGQPEMARVEQSISSLLLGNDVGLKGNGKLSVKWEGYFWPRLSGEYEFEIEVMRAADPSNIFAAEDARANVNLRLDGKLVIHPAVAHVDEQGPVSFFPTDMRRARVKLTAGKPVRLALDYSGLGFRVHTLRLAVRLPRGTIDAAVKAARDADVALVFVGSGSTAESEGRDRDSMNLSGEQDALVQAISAANPRTVVVLHNGAPVAMPWLDKVPAIVEAWLPGQEGNLALADVLFGEVNPSGKLPVTFPRRLQDSPSYPFYPGFRDALYGEGIFMGYRYYDKKEVEPLFPFGHGLSYTRFEYRNLQMPKEISAGQSVPVSVEVRNTGARAGAEVVQFYISDLHCREVCPTRELKQFARVELQPGETRTVQVMLDAGALMHFDAHNSVWHANPGTFRVSAGSSSRDLRVQSEVVLQ